MIKTNIRVSPDQAFLDLAGTVPCWNGDTVAYLRGYGGKDWYQPTIACRPVYRDGWLFFDGVDDNMIEGGTK